jgi:hypothetical protein
MSKKIAILQSNYLPWKGYFDIIGRVDEFIIYDEVQYTKNDWRNRNRIKTRQGVQWMTIPVSQTKLDQKISETTVSQANWHTKHWRTLETNYNRSPYFKAYEHCLKPFYESPGSIYLSEINISLIRIVNEILGIKTAILNSRDFALKGNATDKLIELCKKRNATVYLSGSAAKNYIDEPLFAEANIQIQWMDYAGYPEYPQLHPPFEHAVSIVDLLFNTGPDSKKYMKWNK